MQNRTFQGARRGATFAAVVGLLAAACSSGATRCPVDGRRRVTERGGHRCGAVGRGHGRRRDHRRLRQHRRRVERRHRPKSEEFAFRSVLKPFTDATGI